VNHPNPSYLSNGCPLHDLNYIIYYFVRPLSTVYLLVGSSLDKEARECTPQFVLGQGLLNIGGNGGMVVENVCKTSRARAWRADSRGMKAQLWWE
jgi:hypothetical protein